MTWIQTASGRKFDYLSMDPEQWCIQDIARGLANKCRFSGQLSWSGVWYSVAEHCVHVSYMVPYGHELDGLMHDAVESVMGDVPTPLKKMIPEFGRIEDQLYRAMASKFHVSLSVPRQVKAVDNEILLAERDHLFGPPIEPWDLDSTVAPRLPEHGFPCWSPRAAENAFLTRFEQLVDLRSQRNGY